MKKTIIAMLAASGFASAATYTPLDSADGWISGSNHSDRHTVQPAPTIENGSYSWATNWGQGYSSYDFNEAITLVAGTESTLSLQYTLTTGNTYDGVMTLALIGGNGTDTVVSGMSYKSPLRYAVTDATATNGYTFGTEAGWGTVLSGVNLNNSTAGNTSYTLKYDIAWDAVDGCFELNVSLNGAIATDTPINLGSGDISFSGLKLTTDGGHQGPSYATVSDLTLTVVPEPATATLSLLALAGLAVRRRRK